MSMHSIDANHMSMLFNLWVDVVTEQGIDGEIFMELSENEIKSLVPKLGIAKKIIKLKDKV